jgi:RNA polymerase sigma factor (sigma-70 family)
MDSVEAARCLERASRGDEQAAHDLFHHLYPLVFRLVRAHLPRRTSEEDLHQIAMVKVFSKASQFSGKVPLEHWVSRIVINTCLKQLRAEKVRPELRMGDLTEEQAEVLEKITSTDESPDPHAARAPSANWSSCCSRASDRTTVF